MGWGCYSTDHDSLAFDTVEEFEEHIKVFHKDTFPDSELHVMARINRRPMHPIIEKCPFCEDIAEKDPDLPRHVGQHLRIFALYSLPWPDDSEQIGDESLPSIASVNQPKGVINPGSRHTDWNEFTDVTWPSSSDLDTTAPWYPPAISIEDFEDPGTDNEASGGVLLGRLSEWGGLGPLGTRIEAQHQPLEESEIHDDENLEAFDMHIARSSMSTAPTNQIRAVTTDQNTDRFPVEQRRGGLLRDPYRWVFDNLAYKRWLSDDSSRLLWIRGDIDTGKTTLLRGIISEVEKEPAAVLSYFFCQATDSRVNSATAVLSGLISTLLEHQRRFISLELFEGMYDFPRKLLEEMNTWDSLYSYLKSFLGKTDYGATYLIIDALDECVVGQPQLLDLITQMSAAYPTTKWLVSSRNRPEIEVKLKRCSEEINLRLEIDSSRPSSPADSSISEAATAELVEYASFNLDWPLDLSLSPGKPATGTSENVSGHLEETSKSALPRVAIEGDLENVSSDEEQSPKEEERLSFNADISIGSRASGLELTDHCPQKRIRMDSNDPGLERDASSNVKPTIAGTSHDFTRMSQSAWTDDLMTKLLAARTASKGPTRGWFWPEGSLRRIMTEDSVRNVLLDSELVQFVLQKATKLFALCLYIGMTRSELQDTMEIFRAQNVLDGSLPISISSFIENLPWPVSQKDSFFRSQWEFMAPVFPLDHWKLSQILDLGDAVLPFVEYERVTGAASISGQLYKAQVYPSHFDRDSPVQQVRYQVNPLIETI